MAVLALQSMLPKWPPLLWERKAEGWVGLVLCEMKEEGVSPAPGSGEADQITDLQPSDWTSPDLPGCGA